ncbi:MAG TPA: hypothetical protein VFR23_02575, partial [Jiangellaceae bacterium]|nr:hypothetical protein [Jiangellaceae bacterium]
ASVARAGLMSKRIRPSSSSRDLAREQVPGRRGRVRRGRMSSRAATTDAATADEALLDGLPRRLAEHDTTGFTVLDFLYAAGSPIDALLYARLFWPELLEVDGAVLLASSVEDEADLARVRSSLRERGPVETERRYNLRELSDLFGHGLGEIDDDQAHLRQFGPARRPESRRFPGLRGDWNSRCSATLRIDSA